MKAWIDVENAHTKEVITLEVPIIEFDYHKRAIFDISSIKQDELDALKLAIDMKKELEYTDIELFYVDEDNHPNFGLDYEFKINGNQLVGIYTRDQWLNKKKGDEKNVKK